MKTRVLFMASLLASVMSFGQSLTVDLGVGAAGTLKDKIAEDQRATVEELILKGEINAIDFRLIRDELGNLQKIDMSDAKIMEFEGVGGTFNMDGEDSQYYAADCLPAQAFDCKTTLSSIIFPKTLKQLAYLSIGQTAVTELDFSTTLLEDMEGSSIYSNMSLDKLTLPATIKRLDEGCIIRNDYITTFICLVKDPQTIKDGGRGMFGMNYKYDWDKGDYVYDENGNLVVESMEAAPYAAILYVPKGSLEKYQNAETWNTFVGMQELENDPTGIHNESQKEVKIVSYNGGINLQFAGEAQIRIYTVLGSLVEQINATDQYQTTLDSGLYIVTINGKAYKVSVK